MARSRGWPLRRYLVGLVVLFIVAAGVAVGYGWTGADRDARAAARQDAAFGARLAAGEVDGDVASIKQAVGALAGNPVIAQAFATPAGCELQLDLAGGPDAGHLDLIRTDGTVVCSSRTGTLGSYAAASWWASASRTTTLLAPAADVRTGRPAVLFTTPVPGAGVVAGFVNLAVLGGVLGDLYGGPRHLTYLLTTSDGGTVLTRSVEPARWVGAPAAGTALGWSYQRVDVPGPGWHLYAGADRSAALAAAHRLAVRQILVIGAGLLVVLIAALVVHRRITGPIGRLAAAVHRAAGGGGTSGGTGGPTELPADGPTEVAALAAEFTAMLAAVEHELGRRRDAEQAALAAQRSYREVFDHNPFPMLVVDTDSRAILEVNDAAVAHYGYDRPEFLALTLTDLRLPEDRSVEEVPADHPEVPVRHVRKDGSVIDVVVTSHALTFNGRSARCAVIEDVTDKENVERRLRQSQRLESLGQLAGGVAHDFNNLLGVITGYTRFAVDDLGAAARTDLRWLSLQEDLNQVLKASDRAAGLTRQLLSFARREVARPQVVDLDTVVTDIEQMLRRTIGDDITLHTGLSGDLPAVTADPGQLEQILLNLAVNARDAMPTGGTLAIETSEITVDAHYAASRPGARPGRYVRLRVSDTGTGMSHDTVERAFEPFFTTKPLGQGTGLGLATVYGIVTAAGGHIHLHSTPGVGTTVTVLLPATSTVAPAPSEVGVRRPRAGQGETILVVEDEDALRVLTERMLIRHGYQVLTAANGPAALTVAADHPGHLDLLVTDVVMPAMPGHELATRLRRSHPGLLVIYVSGYAEPILANQKTLPAGVTLLTKPVPEQVLLTAVREALDTADAGHLPAPGPPVGGRAL